MPKPINQTRLPHAPAAEVARRPREAPGPGAPRPAAYLVLDAVGSEAERCRSSGPRAAAVRKILGIERGPSPAGP